MVNHMAATVASDGLDSFRMAVTGVMRRQREGVSFACDEDMSRTELGRVRGVLTELAREQGWDVAPTEEPGGAAHFTLTHVDLSKWFSPAQEGGGWKRHNCPVCASELKEGEPVICTGFPTTSPRLLHLACRPGSATAMTVSRR
jgi:hypothetical protein